jgi:hypothetical protein
VKLTVDHVVPVALGGTDEPTNLVAACRDCNGGKTSSSPDAPIVANVADDALRWSQALVAAADRMRAELARQQDIYDRFDECWDGWKCGPDKTPVPRPSDWRGSVDSLLAAGLPLDVLEWCVGKAMASKVRTDAAFRYMCGIAWRKVTELQDAARLAVTGADEDAAYDEYEMHQDGRRQMACELLGELTEEECDRALDHVRSTIGLDSPAVAETAAFSVFTDAIRDRKTALSAINHLLDAMDGGHQCLEDATASLEASHGRDYTEASRLFLAANMAIKSRPLPIGKLI